MKRRLAFLLAIVMIFGTAAAGCGKKDKSSGAQKAAEASAEEIPYEEELPLANELIHEAPIPADTGTLELTEQSYDDMGLMLRLPSDVTAQQTEEGITVTDDAGSWTMSFTPFTQGEYYTRRAAADHGSGDSREYREADRCDTEFKGFQGFISTANIQSTGYSVNDGERIPELDLLLDYGSEYVGKWAGVQVTLRPTGSYSDTNIYELLYLRHIRALLNGFEPVKDYGAETVSAGGITASLPARWAPKADEDSGAVTAHIVNGSDRGGLLITSVSASDPAAYAKKQAERTGAEVFTKSCGSVSCTGFIRTLTSSSVDEYDEKKKTETCIAELYSDMGGGRAVRTVVSLRGADSEELNAFLDSGVFTDALSTVTADAAGYTASEGGGSFTCDEYGLITGYSGGSAVTVPTEVNGVTVTGIADGAFKSSSITSIDFPAGVTEIGSNAFSGCTALAGTSFSEGLMFIDNAAFSGCKSLNDVSLPETVSYVGSEAFAKAGKGSFSCAGEPKFDSKALYASAFGDIYTAGGDLGAAKVMNSCKAVSIKLGEGVEKLGYDCMSDCEKLTSVTLPHGLKKLGKYCMSYDPKLHRVDIPERVELIPEGCFSETRLDVLVLPENVTGMEHYAVTNAAYLAICNREIKLGMEAFNVERVYLEGVYLSEDVPRGLENQYVSMQVYLPMDANTKESENLDAFLNGIGFGEIAWIGTDPDFLPADSTAFKVSEDYEVTGYTDSEGCLYIPHCAFGEQVNKQIYRIKKNVFRGSKYSEIYFNSNLDTVPANAFADSAGLTDLWFSGAIEFQLTAESVAAGCFYGLPDNITVHLPARIAEEDRSALEEKLKSKGIPSGAAFDYYTL